MALRPTESGLAYAALILHGLFHVPQFRHAIAQWLPHPAPGREVAEPPKREDGPCECFMSLISIRFETKPVAAYQTWTLLEIFCNVDLARLTDLDSSPALKAFTTVQWTSPAERPAELSSRARSIPL